jgi:hypothetical protein
MGHFMDVKIEYELANKWWLNAELANQRWLNAKID